ncbi:MAG: IS110 family transposase [Treponema sp.]|jgi:transposase|nr:IS110 family transposase [Treponema sp.]
MINVGVDLHKTQFTVYETSGEWKQYRTSERGYAEFFERVRDWQEGGEEVRIGVESTGNTRYFKNQLETVGCEVRVINTLKFKVVNESVKKTDKHDAATIAEFLSKDMLPESQICTEESEQIRRLLKSRQTLVRAGVTIKNQIHALLTGIGMEDKKASLQSKKGRQRILDALKETGNVLVVQPLIDTISSLEENVKVIEKEIEKLTVGDKVVELLKTIPGCGNIGAWTIRAHTDDIKRFASAKKYAAYAGLVPWVQNSNERIHHGKITKRGPEELRTALVQLVLGMRRSKKKTVGWRIMNRYEMMRKTKGTGKSIIASARKVSCIIWTMLTNEKEFDCALMLDKKLSQTADSMRNLAYSL